jgi:hypothetical protein
MDFTSTNQADAKSRIPKTDGLGLPVPTNSINDQTDTKVTKLSWTAPKTGLSPLTVRLNMPTPTIIKNPTMSC